MQVSIKWISTLQNNLSPNITITSFNDHFFHELDTVNFLSSGKEWFGEEFANTPGHSLARNFSVNVSNLQAGSPLTIVTDCLARSVTVGSRFDVSINNQLVQQIIVPPIGVGQYDAVAQESQNIANTSTTQPNLSIGYSYVPGSFNSQGWLNWFEIFS